METPQKLREIIENGISSNINFHTTDYDFMLEQLWLVLFDTTTSLKRITDKLDISKTPDKEFSCLLILTNCIVDIHSAYQSLRHGFHRAAATTARGMIENLALSVAIKTDESNKIFDEYKSDKYDIPSAITPAKKHFPELGKFYGVLSNKFVHEPYESIGRAFVQEGKTTTLLLVPPVGRNGFLPQYVLILNLACLTSSLGQAIEWTFANFVEPSVYWEMQGSGQLKRRDAPNFTAISKISDKLESIKKLKKPEA